VESLFCNICYFISINNDAEAFCRFLSIPLQHSLRIDSDQVAGLVFASYLQVSLAPAEALGIDGSFSLPQADKYCNQQNEIFL
jgi:hypothetical protein